MRLKYEKLNYDGRALKFLKHDWKEKKTGVFFYIYLWIKHKTYLKNNIFEKIKYKDKNSKCITVFFLLYAYYNLIFFKYQNLIQFRSYFLNSLQINLKYISSFN